MSQEESAQPLQTEQQVIVQNDEKQEIKQTVQAAQQRRIINDFSNDNPRYIKFDKSYTL